MLRLLLPLLFILDCGSPNTAFVTSQDKQRIDVLLAGARIDFDRNKLSDAEQKATEAYNRNTHNQTAALQLANIYMSEGNASILEVAIQIASDLSTSTNTSTATGTSTSTSLKTVKATDVLGDLSDLVNLSATDLSNLGTLQSGVINSPDSTFFQGLDVYYPLDPGSLSTTSSPRYTVAGLRYINKAIALLCPFIPSSITNGSSDPRDKCTKVTDSTSSSVAQVLFSYAINHLVEAIYFNYANPTVTVANPSQNSNLLQRVKAIQNVQFTATNAVDYANAVVTLKDNIDAIFQTTSTSMLTATMLDISMTVSALSSIAGFPPSMIAKIQAVLTNLQKALTKVNQENTSLTNQTQALKDQLTESLAKSLSKSVNAFLNSIPASQQAAQQEQITSVCNAYTEMVNAFLTTKAQFETPAGCQNITD